MQDIRFLNLLNVKSYCLCFAKYWIIFRTAVNEYSEWNEKSYHPSKEHHNFKGISRHDLSLPLSNVKSFFPLQWIGLLGKDS